MGVTNSNKVISTDQIACDGSLKVTLALTAAPDIVSNPTDIVLVLDRSGSMTGTPLTNMKDGAKTFIDIISEATGGAQDDIHWFRQPYRHCQLRGHCRGQYAADHICGYPQECGGLAGSRGNHQSC